MPRATSPNRFDMPQCPLTRVSSNWIPGRLNGRHDQVSHGRPGRPGTGSAGRVAADVLTQTRCILARTTTSDIGAKRPELGPSSGARRMQRCDARVPTVDAVPGQGVAHRAERAVGEFSQLA